MTVRLLARAARFVVPAILATIAALTMVAAPAQAATPRIMITKVYVNPPGADTPVTNTKLNGEYIVLKNTTHGTINLKYWTIRDKQSTASGHIYRFSASFYLGAGKSVTVHTGQGTNTSTHRYWGRSGPSTYAYIWNNTGGDAAYVRDSANRTVDTCSWSGSVASYKLC